MDIAKESEEGEAHNILVSSAAFHDDIVKLLDFIERSKNETHPLVFYGKGILEKLKLSLTILLRLFQLSSPDFDDFKATISRVSYEIQSEDDVIPAIFRLLDSISYYSINLHHHSKSRTAMIWEQLVELLDSIFFMKLHDLSTDKSFFPLMNQYEALKNICGNIRDFHWLEVNGYIEPKIVESVISESQHGAERVGHFCLVLVTDQLNQFVPFFKRLNLPRVDAIAEIIPTALEVMHMCFTELRGSKSVEVSRFITQLLETTPHILREYLIQLETHMLDGLECLSSLVNIVGGSTRGSVPGNVDSGCLHEMLSALLNEMSSNWISLDVSFLIESHIKSELLMQYMSKMLRRHPGWVDYDMTCPQEHMYIVYENKEYKLFVDALGYFGGRPSKFELVKQV